MAMKMFIFFFALAACCCGSSYAQHMAYAPCSDVRPVLDFSTDAGNGSHKFQLSPESRVGFGITSSGIVLGCAGIGIYERYKGGYPGGERYRDEKIGAGLWLVGGVVAIMGSVFAIDGSIHDMHRYYKQHWFSLASGGDGVGIAYNF